MLLAEFLLNLNNKWHGHHQTSISGIPVKQGLEICKELKKYDTQNLYAMELFTDMSYSIFRKADVVKGETEDFLVLSVEP